MDFLNKYRHRNTGVRRYLKTSLKFPVDATTIASTCAIDGAFDDVINLVLKINKDGRRCISRKESEK
jgi:hypothetical protein